MRVIYGVDSRWEVSKSYFPFWLQCLWPQDYFSINFTQSSEYKSDAPTILQVPSLERKRTRGVPGTKDVFQLRDLPQCGEESASSSCCRNDLSFRIKMSTVRESKVRAQTLVRYEAVPWQSSPWGCASPMSLGLGNGLCSFISSSISPSCFHWGIVKQFSGSWTF